MFGTDISMDLLIQYGLQAASGLLILGIGAFIAKSAGRYTHKALGKIEMEPPIRLLLVRVVKGIIFLFTLLVMLQQFGIQIFPLIAGLGVAGVGIGLALQGVFLNLFCWVEYYHHQTFSRRRIYRYPGRTWRSPSHRSFHDQTSSHQPIYCDHSKSENHRGNFA
jgi:hypothetical protein